MKSIFYLKNTGSLHMEMSLKLLDDILIYLRPIINLENADDTYPFNYKDETYQLTIIPGSKKGSQTIEIAESIINLLSFALGRRVIFDRYRINNTIEDRQMVRVYNTGIQIVPDFQIVSFLSECFGSFLSKDEDYKKMFRITSDFLYQTRNEYVDDRVMSAMQAWECYMNYFNKKCKTYKSKQILPTELYTLKQELKPIIKKWLENSTNSAINEETKIASRIFSAFANETLLNKTYFFINERKLNIDLFELDVRLMKANRDQVAHNGFIKNINNDEDRAIKNVKHLGALSRMLQILILEDLSYTGLVIDVKKDWRTYNKVPTYFM